MRLIAKKPCSFGGQKFFIGDEIPKNLVADAKLQEQRGVITIADGSAGGSGGNPEPPSGPVMIPVRGWNYSESGLATEVQATPEQIQQVFSFLQCTAEEVVKSLVDIVDENILVLLYAVDNRATVRNAAKKQADRLHSEGSGPDRPTTGDASNGSSMEGADT